MMQSRENWRNLYTDAMNYANQLRFQLCTHTTDMAQELKDKD